MRTLIDTSFLVRIAELGTDLLAKVEEKLGTKIVPVVIPEVVEELRTLTRGRGIRAKRAGLALLLCDTLEQLDATMKEEDADLALLRTAKALGLPVLTCDGRLRRDLRSAGIGVIYVDKKGEVRVEGFVP